jgi:hypothetical protein
VSTCRDIGPVLQRRLRSQFSLLLQQGNMGTATSEPTTSPHTPFLRSREYMEVIWAVVLLLK